MPHKLIAILLVLVLMGCDRQPPAASTEGINESAAQQHIAVEQPVLDYAWNFVGPDFSNDDLDSVAAEFNRRINGGDYGILTANILKPQFETADFDLVWVILWSSAAAREAGWAAWQRDSAVLAEGGNASVIGPFHQIYSFTPQWTYRSPTFNPKAGDPFFSKFNVCSKKDDTDDAELMVFQARHNDWLASDVEPNSYGKLTLEPRFSLSTADFVVLEIFGSEEAIEKNDLKWRDAELNPTWNAMVSCETYKFSSMKIRLLE